MKHRQTEAYIDVFREIKKEEPLWNPFTLFAIREESLSQAVQKVFPKCEIIPGWFHLVQVIMISMHHFYKFAFVNYLLFIFFRN